MAELDEVIAGGVAENAAPFVVAMWGRAAGPEWSGAAGDAAAGRPAAEDTVFRIFSMTKAVGAFAAAQMIDRGAFSLDTPVEEILPEWREIQVLEGMDGATPRLRAPKTKATIRNLATHTTGNVYEFWNADIQAWMGATEHPTIVSGLERALSYPLVFDPGARWDYGIGIDWLGRCVERVDGRRIDQYCREEIFEPLGMPDTGFEVSEAMRPRLAEVRARGEDGAFGPFELAPPSQPEFYGMGHALYSTAPDYMRFLRMLMKGGELDGRRVIGAETLGRLLENQIGALRMGPMRTVAPPISADVDLFPGIDKTHSFFCMRVEGDVPGMRSAGAQAWAGVLNTHYWFDPSRDVIGLIMTQTLPFVEPPFLRLYERFERAVYRAAG